MRVRHAARIWMVAGAIAVALLAVSSWLILIHPKRVETNEVERQTDDTQAQVMVLRQRISELQKQQSTLTTLQAELRRKQTALPSDSGVPAFLNQLERSGSDNDVVVTGIEMGEPTRLPDLSTVWALPITLSADGSMVNLERFLTALQTGQARALLIENANVEPGSGLRNSTGAGTTNTGSNTTAGYPTGRDALTDDAPGTTTNTDNTPDTGTTSNPTSTGTTGDSTPSTTTTTNTPSTTTPSTPTTTNTTTPSTNTNDVAGSDTTSGVMSISLSLKAFVAPPAGTGVPSTTTK